MRSLVLWGIRRRFHRLCPSHGYVAHALRTLAPVAASVLLHRAAPRLACVKPAASVHPEPGSNSSLYIHIMLSCPDAFCSLFGINAALYLWITTFVTIPVLACTFLSVFSMSFFNFLRFLAGVKKSRSLKRDCKGINFFLTCKIILNFFQKIFSQFRLFASACTRSLFF